MTDTPPAVGSIRLADSATPALEAGLYRLTSTLAVERREPGGSVSPLAAPPPHIMHFEVSGPRFAIDRADIGDRYPAPDAHGAFGDRLPHVALCRRTLPWERAAGGTPWLALMVFASDEAQLSTGALGTRLPATVVTKLKALDPFTDDPQVTVVRAKDPETFRGVLPSRSDVKFLAHVRRVNLADTALAGQDDDGIFAVVTANRLALPGSAGGTRYLACLVSLEGRDDAWNVPDGQAPPPLIVLHSWSFTSIGVGGTFQHLAASLDAAPFGAPAAGSAAAVATDGTVPVERVGRDGISRAVNYRGPLLGLATGRPLGNAPSDMSVDAAFELGRLLGASDGRFLRELTAWHRASDSAARAAIVSGTLARIVAPAEAPPARAGRATASGRAVTPGPAATAKSATTASVKDALAARLATIPGTPANLWRVHPAAAGVAGATRKASGRAAARGAPAKKTTSPRKGGTATPKAQAKVAGKAKAKVPGKAGAKARSKTRAAAAGEVAAKSSEQAKPKAPPARKSGQAVKSRQSTKAAAKGGATRKRVAPPKRRH